MSEAAHTPGPWEAVDLSGTPINDPSVMSAKHCIATVWINDLSRKKAVANARLLAAAPEMLTALKAVEDWWLQEGMHHNSGAPYAVFATRAAIAKAEGRS